MCFPWSQYAPQITNQCALNSSRQDATSSPLLGWLTALYCVAGETQPSTTFFPFFFLLLPPSTISSSFFSWPWIATRSCCPSSASATSRALLWRAQALALPLVALSPQRQHRAAPAPLFSTLPTPWSRYHHRWDLWLNKCGHSGMFTLLFMSCGLVFPSPGEVPAWCGDGFGV